MPRLLPPGYFARAPFAAAGPELFRTHTCLGCGARAATWAAFRAHRRTCTGRLEAVGEPVSPGRARPRAALPAATAARDPFLEALAAAQRRLEAWRRALERAAGPAGGAPAA
jgi:hypothetical protein